MLKKNRNDTAKPRNLNAHPRRVQRLLRVNAPIPGVFIEGRHSRSSRSSARRPGSLGFNAPGQGPVQFAASPSPSAEAGGRRRRVSGGHLEGQRDGFDLLLIVFSFIVVVWSTTSSVCVVLCVGCVVWYGAREREREAQEGKKTVFLWSSCGTPS
jgi:hypothetical protein